MPGNRLELRDSFTVTAADGKEFTIRKWVTVVTGKKLLNGRTSKVDGPISYDTDDGLSVNSVGGDFEILTNAGRVRAKRTP